MRFETKAIHEGQEPEPAYGAVNVPIYQTSTYAQLAVGKHLGYEYARTGNPTRTALQTALAGLEDGAGAVCFSSGMAAEANFFYLLKPGDHVVLGNDVYGGTYRLVSKVLAPWGLAYDV
ncbi:MAG TPA: cystathionine gamma-synthase, partial [Actinobacteria bacterium]|nr:cystathionine gamma-synthase [Actinomycetota bacterium]